MKKRLFGSILFFAMVVCGGLFCTQNTSAYYKDNCYAIQYLKEVNAKGDVTVKTLYSTKLLCYKNGKLEIGSVPTDKNGSDKIVLTGNPDEGSGLKMGPGHPKFTKVDNGGKNVTLEYCKSGVMICANPVTKVFSLDDHDGNFEALAREIQEHMASLPKTPSHCTLLGFDQNVEVSETTPTEEGDNERNEECYKNSGALGWILCPLISNVADALGAVYDSMVEPFLVIEPELLQGDGTYTAWDIFRNFANIAFVILFLAVIFSQLTGVGIDNYGIKRMLPKLIVAAVLINLSYLICQLAVDVSNILGNSLNTLFINIAGQVNTDANSPTTFFSNTVATVGSVLGVGATAGAAFVVFSATIASGFALIIPILATVISAIIAVLFMFAILFVRKAIAILLVAVAPVAFVAYIMPNTKRVIFDKWLNVFKGVLLLYPLAGALIGGGLLASAVIISALGASAESGNAGLQEFFMYIGALLIQVVPFFFLPTLFRRSLAALGNVGERLGRAGVQLGAGASRRFRENEGVRAMQATLAAGREGGLRQRIAGHRGMRYLGGNGMARNRMRYQKLRSDEGSLGAMFGEDYMLATETANVMKELEASGDINDSGLLGQRLQAALVANDSHTTEGRARIRAYTDALSAKGDSGRDAVKRAYNSAAPNMSQTAAETFAANIMAHHAADYKNNSRSMFDVANGINNRNITRNAQNGYQTTDQYVGAHKNQLQTSAKAETMAAMDDSAFAEAFMNGSYENGTVNNLNGLNTEERLAVGENAYHALQNTTNMKADRVALLKQVLQQSGYRPPVQEVHNNP